VFRCIGSGRGGDRVFRCIGSGRGGDCVFRCNGSGRGGDCVFRSIRSGRGGDDTGALPCASAPSVSAIPPVVELRAIRFAYPARRGREAPAFEIRDLSVAVEPGEILGLIGPNASGKTTVVRLVSGLLAPSSGAIHLEGTPLARLTPASIATRVAVVPQDVPRGFPYTVEELVLMGRFPHAPGRFFESREDRAAAREAMALAEVEALRGEPMERLSGGERQRVLMARALAQRPRLLLLDEPTAHLDLRHQVACVSLLRRLNRSSGLTVILVTHDLSLAGEVCDRLLLLDAGRAALIGAPESVLDAAVLESVYGCAVEVSKHPESGRPTVAVIWPDGSGRSGREGR
jgi:iron complex transport system ATP-binding protein